MKPSIEAAEVRKDRFEKQPGVDERQATNCGVRLSPNQKEAVKFPASAKRRNSFFPHTARY